MERLLLILILFTTSIQIFSQSNLQNKYWYYRQRLTDYFVKAGPNVGESVVAEMLNVNQTED